MTMELKNHILCHKVIIMVIFVFAIIILSPKIAVGVTGSLFFYQLAIFASCILGIEICNKRNCFKPKDIPSIQLTINLLITYLTIHYIISIVFLGRHTTYSYLSFICALYCGKYFYKLGISYNSRVTTELLKYVHLCCLSFSIYIFLKQIVLLLRCIGGNYGAEVINEFININPYILSALFACVFIPFKKIYIFPVIVLSLLGIFITAKRGPMFSILIGVAIVFIRFWIRRSFKIFIVVSPLLVIGYLLINHYIGESVVLFTERLEDTGGSGRIAAWSRGYDIFISNGLLTQLFGMGYGTVNDLMAKAWGLNIFSHSDFFDILFQLGYLGMFLILILDAQIIWAMCTTRNNKYLPWLFFSGCYIITTTLYTSSLFYPSASIYFMLFFLSLSTNKNNSIVSKKLSLALLYCKLYLLSFKLKNNKFLLKN